MSMSTMNPLADVQAEMDRAAAAGVALANAVTLATVDATGRPRARVVLIKGVDDVGVDFYTNYQSNKAADLAATPAASLAVYWHETLTQIRIAGTVEKVSAEASDAYFATRPRASQIGAWASDQSRPLASRDALLARVAEVEQRFAGRDVDRPPHWGGYRLLADDVELWHDGEARLHDRFRYRLRDGTWSRERLNP
jgi:pyridoxamine 5'-phosphate oxidase